ncbi:DUF2628 domain-containing protein [Rhodoligotrophos defluvii]|uniref:DUF2628 domain-containing protein n=1 Tax=Rhodoligotrophos defluvii TaxID=2561934 RepID=UPI0010C96CDE|nr:DUF2628 domain-containing protein [Rhodoligotrophos defluvii]
MSSKTYSVHHRSSDPAIILAEADRLDFVKEGFSWPAFFVPFLWLIYKRMWIVLALFIGVSVCIGLIPYAWPISATVQTILGFGINLVMGLQGNDLLRWTLARRGKREIAVVVGDRLVAAEHRFFTALCAQAGQKAGLAPSAARAQTRPAAGHDYSILPEPGRV